MHDGSRDTGASAHDGATGRKCYSVCIACLVECRFHTVGRTVVGWDRPIGSGGLGSGEGDGLGGGNLGDNLGGNLGSDLLWVGIGDGGRYGLEGDIGDGLDGGIESGLDGGIECQN